MVTLAEMTLLERQTQLAELAAAERDAAAGQGSLVIVSGAAGVGKTTLVRRYAEESSARVLWGLCDDLLTPRPLGPFRDMFAQRGRPPDFPDFLGDVLDRLGAQPSPTCAVVEDVHWADQATLDAIRFLGRRVARMRAMLLVTYRDDEVPADHPLRLALGLVPSADIRRLRLPPLSRSGVAALAGRADVDDLYELTGGNPFFVREVLAAPDESVPSTIQDAVAARVSRLDGSAVASVDVVSVVPGRAERPLLEACGVSDGLDEAVRQGLLECDPDDDTVAFRNELARRAVEDGLASARRREINRQVLDVLVRQDAEPARVAHHAAQAGDVDAVAAYAPVAARRAASLEAHQAAAEHYEQALQHPGRFTQDELADVLEAYAKECRLVGRRLGGAVEAVEQAHAIWAKRKDDRRGGRCLVLLAEVLLMVGRSLDAERAADASVNVLTPTSDGETLAAAYAVRARTAMVGGRFEEAVTWGEKARTLGFGQLDTEAAAHLDVTIATARSQLDPDDVGPLAACLDDARSARMSHPAARAYVNLAIGSMRRLRYEAAHRYITEGLAYCEENDQLLDAMHLRAVRATCYFDAGRWHEAEQDIRSVEDTPRLRRGVLWLRGLVLARRGDPATAMTLAEVRTLAEDSGSRESLLCALSAQAELAFLRGSEPDPADADRMSQLLAEPPVGRGADDAALWLARAGRLDGLPDGLSEPRALHVSGRWREAARAWDAVGRPYDRADALADADEPEPLLEALEILNQLGASARAAMVRMRLAELGVSRVPRGPRRVTLANPAGLTPRQSEVLRLLSGDLTYQQIARRLNVSIKTVDHHATIVRSKLDVHSREDAVAVGRRLGLVPPDKEPGHA